MERSSYDWNCPGLSIVLDSERERERGRESGGGWQGEEKLLQTAPASHPCRQLLMRTRCGWREPANRGTRLSHPCWDDWVTAAYTSLDCTPFPMCSEVAWTQGGPLQEVAGCRMRDSHVCACGRGGVGGVFLCGFAVKAVHLLSLASC